jgi:hypothetical protein
MPEMLLGEAAQAPTCIGGTPYNAAAALGTGSAAASVSGATPVIESPATEEQQYHDDDE